MAAAEHDGIPTRAEIEHQLSRMLASRRLKGAPNRHMLLDYLVRKYLKDEEVSEEIIGDALFPNYASDESDVVRITASQLRGSISMYYASEGLDDLVIISLPPGPKYRPAFSYNPHREYIARYRIGIARLEEPNGDAGAEAAFCMAVEKRPQYAAAWAALADANLRKQLSYRSITPSPRPLDFGPVEKNALRAIELDDGHWYGHYMYGAVKLCQWHWEEAKRSFKRALQLNHEECHRRFWYAVFLLVTGETDKCVHNVQAAAREKPENFYAQIKAATFTYLAGESRKAKPFLGAAAGISWSMQLLVLVMAHIDLGELDQAEDLATSYEIATIPYCFTGVVVYLRVKRGRLDSAGDLYYRMQPRMVGRFKQYQQPEQMLIAHLAAGNAPDAIEALKQLANERHPLMLVVDTWALLDPLRNIPEFQALIREMNLPDRT